MWGTAISAGVGGLGALLSMLGKSRRPQMEPIQRYTPEQQAALNQVLQQGLAESDFGPIEAHERRQFFGDTVPQLSERFAGLGGGLDSSGFIGSLGEAGAGLHSQLAALRARHGLGKLQMGLAQRFDPYVMPESMGTMQGVGSMMSQFGFGLLPQISKYEMMKKQHALYDAMRAGESVGQKHRLGGQ